eukprot:14510606-Ditylum_brightwellii.AAC.1
MLRSSIESYVESLDTGERERISDGVNHVEGHSKFISLRHYKRQGSEVTMRSWSEHVSPLIDHLKNDNKFNEADLILD